MSIWQEDREAFRVAWVGLVDTLKEELHLEKLMDWINGKLES